MLKAIETKYNGYLFRSRLEARWAVFFDCMNVKYLYEREGYDLDGMWYLPDFWIPSWNCWVEIKPEVPSLYEEDNGLQQTERKEYRLCQKLAQASCKVVMIIGGDPWIDEKAYHNSGNYEHEYGIAIFSSDLIKCNNEPNNDLGINLNIPLYDNDSITRLTKEFYTSDHRLYGHLKRNYIDNPQYFSKELPQKDDIHGLIEADNEYYRNKFGKENPIWKYGITSTGLGFTYKNNVLGICNMPKYQQPDAVLVDAFVRARQARF